MVANLKRISLIRIPFTLSYSQTLGSATRKSIYFYF